MLRWSEKWMVREYIEGFVLLNRKLVLWWKNFNLVNWRVLLMYGRINIWEYVKKESMRRDIEKENRVLYYLERRVVSGTELCRYCVCEGS